MFLGSSFAFIGAIALTLSQHGIGVVKGGIIAAGLIYVIMSYIIKKFGVNTVHSFFPPIVTGPIVMVIGLRLSPTALQMSGYFYDTKAQVSEINPKYLLIAGIVVITMILVSIFAKGFFKLVPILISVLVGYFVSILFGLVEFEPIKEGMVWFFSYCMGTYKNFSRFQSNRNFSDRSNCPSCIY